MMMSSSSEDELQAQRRSSDDDAEPPPPELRAWHRSIAERILSHESRAPEPSRGRTALRCQCAELAAAGGRCALHQEAGAGALEWVRRVPRVGGYGRVVVPRLSRGDSIATVTEYAHWRRSVWMPTRFYVENAAARSVA